MDKSTDDIGEEERRRRTELCGDVSSRLTRRSHAKLEKMKKNVGAGSSLVRHVLVLVWLAR